MAQKALLVYGGWDGHQPQPVAEILAGALRQDGFEVEVSDTLDAFKDRDKLMKLSLIVPHWTMGKITGEQLKPVLDAVESGVGLAGCHGGMCDAFRDATDWHFATGGQWVAHPGNDGVKYTVHITDSGHPITTGLEDFTVASEQYYLHVDPGVKVLAVDDQSDTHDLIILALTRYGAEVRASTSVSAALKMIQDWQPDVLVSDIGMPGEDGYALIRAVRALPEERGGSIPALALTCFSSPS